MAKYLWDLNIEDLSLRWKSVYDEAISFSECFSFNSLILFFMESVRGRLSSASKSISLTSLTSLNSTGTN